MSGKKIDELTLAEQLTKLDEVLGWFERDDFDVEEALSKYQTGMELTKHISEKLQAIENKIEVLKIRFDQEV